MLISKIWDFRRFFAVFFAFLGDMSTFENFCKLFVFSSRFLVLCLRRSTFLFTYPPRYRFHCHCCEMIYHATQTPDEKYVHELQKRIAVSRVFSHLSVPIHRYRNFQTQKFLRFVLVGCTYFLLSVRRRKALVSLRKLWSVRLTGTSLWLHKMLKMPFFASYPAYSIFFWNFRFFQVYSILFGDFYNTVGVWN